jgi:hypothetical protein
MSLCVSGSTGSVANRVQPFPDPFFDYASMAMPKSLEEMLEFGERLTFANGIYASAINRVIGFFVTEVTLKGGSRSEREKYKQVLNNTLGIRDVLRQVGLNYMAYGNVFVSVLQRFRRSLGCRHPGCGFEAPLENVRGHQACQFEWKSGAFHATCPQCKQHGKWEHRDRRSTDEKDLFIKLWSPRQMQIRHESVYETKRYVWKIPAHERQQIKTGEEMALQHFPWQVIEAIEDNADLLFERDMIYHMNHPTLAGILNRGWGVPPAMAAFRQAWYVQVLHRFNETIGMDYVMPLRLVTPQPRPGAATPEVSDPMFTMDLSGFSSHMTRILASHRRDPSGWHVAPYPVQYQIMGAEATALAPYQLLELGRDDLLNALCVPVEFYKGTLSIQAAPLSLRLMESNWSHLTYMLNKFLQWLLDRISEIMSWEKVTGTLERPSQIDDLNRQLAKLQLMAANEISRTTGYQTMGMQFEDEVHRKYEEQEIEGEIAEEYEEKQQGKQLAQAMAQPVDPATGQPLGGAPSGGAPSGGALAGPQPGAAGLPGASMLDAASMGQDPVETVLGILPQAGDTTVTLPEIQQIADAIAQQAAALPPPMKISLLRRLKTRHDAIHSLVKSRLEQYNSALEAQGRSMGMMAATAPGMTTQVSPAAMLT